MRARLAPLLILAACSAVRTTVPDPPPVNAQEAPPRHLSQVCVIRGSVLGQAVTLVVRDNGQLVGATQGTGYFCYLLQPGPHALTSAIDDPGALQGPQELRFAAAPGERYFVEQDMGMFRHAVRFIAADRAARMLGELEYQVIVSTGGGEPLPGLVPVAMAQTP